MSTVWLNGTLTDKLDARVNPFDHGFLYGDGVWEHLRLFNGTPFASESHYKVLRAAGDALAIDIPLSLDELVTAICATATANNRAEGYVRVIVTRGPGTIGPDPRKCEPQVIITAEEYRPFPDELYGHGLHATVAPLALDPDNLAHRYRTLNQLHVVHAKRFALQNGCLEALFPNRAGHVVGATEGAVFAVTGGDMRGPAAACGFAIPATECALTLADLHAAGEVFIAGTACGVIGVVCLDGRDIGPGTEGPVTRRTRELYQQHTRAAPG
jgi:branched-chain amino acid aminotransferase